MTAVPLAAALFLKVGRKGYFTLIFSSEIAGKGLIEAHEVLGENAVWFTKNAIGTDGNPPMPN